jgi:hypothetical protein
MLYFIYKRLCVFVYCHTFLNMKYIAQDVYGSIFFNLIQSVLLQRVSVKRKFVHMR